MRFLITDSVPLNGGDEALLRALVDSVQSRWPHATFDVLCKDVERCRGLLPDLKLETDPAFVHQLSNPMPTMERVVSLYRRADVVVSSPGGFLNDHYEIEGRLRGLEIGLNMEKTVVLFAQSIGPFRKEDSIRRIREVLNRCTSILVRDGCSREHLLGCGVEPTRIHRTTDAVFLWRRLAPELFRPHVGPARLIGLCIREWPLFDSLSVQDTIAKATGLTLFLLRSNPHRRVRFLSTCQGVDGYKDDSTLALQVVEALPTELQARCEIDRRRHAPQELIRRFSEHDAFIGMRLHACLMSMLGGCPALGLGYESKTSEIFQDLGLGSYQVDYSSDVEAWIGCTKTFLRDLDEIRGVLASRLDAAANCVQTSIGQLTPPIASFSSP